MIKNCKICGCEIEVEKYVNRTWYCKDCKIIAKRNNARSYIKRKKDTEKSKPLQKKKDDILKVIRVSEKLGVSYGQYMADYIHKKGLV